MRASIFPAGASVAGISVAAGASVAGISVAAGASVAGAAVAAGGGVVAAPPHAANREANTSNVNRLNNFLVFILFSPLEFGCERDALSSLILYYWICRNTT
jgi:hypothetical protein